MCLFLAGYCCQGVMWSLTLLVSATINTYTEECHVSNGWGFFFY